MARTTVSFVVPVSTDRPSTSTVQVVDPAAAPTASPSVLFATHHVPQDPVSAAKEAVRQAGLMMERTKATYEASMAAYNASSALRTNVQVCLF